MSSGSSPKDELDRLMRDAAQKAQDISQRTNDIQQAAQQVWDLANAGRERLKHPLSDNIDWEGPIDSWSRANEQLNRTISGLVTISSQAISSSGSSVSAAMTSFVPLPNPLPPLPPQQLAAAQSAQSNLNNVIDQSIRKDQLIGLMAQFGLAKAQPGRKSATEQFETAWAAYERPVTSSSPVNTSLLPMREATQTTVDELLHRRPAQEPASNQRSKILSICRQLARAGKSEGDIQAWANAWDTLVNELSGTKSANYSRDAWRNLLRRATLFLQELLQGLDPAKLK